jgi:hypothetical protein
MARANPAHVWGIGLGASALLVSLSGCGSHTLSPQVDGTPALSPVNVAERRVSDLPAIRDVRIDPRGDLLSVEFRLEPVPGPDRLPLDPSPASGTSWFFVLTLDPDQSRTTGRELTPDFEVVPLTRSELTVREPGQMTIGSIAFDTKPNRVEFTVPRALLGDDDGLVDYTLDLFEVEIVGGDRDIEHVATLQGTNHPMATAASQVPLVMDMRTEIRSGTFFLRARMESRDGLAPIFYSADAVGGWQFQLFVNADGLPTGYWNGYDYVVRGGEQQNGGYVIRTTDNVETNPGGWGPETGTAKLDLTTRQFELLFPLQAIGNDDGQFDFVLETYATLPCSSCPNGTTASLLDDYFGTTGARRQAPMLAGPGLPFDKQGLLADRRPFDRKGRTSDTDY